MCSTTHNADPRAALELLKRGFDYDLAYARASIASAVGHAAPEVRPEPDSTVICMLQKALG